MSLKGFLEGGLASIIAGCSTHPFDLIKVRMQLEGEAATTTASQSGCMSCAGAAGPIAITLRLVQAEGVQGLFCGVSATVLRQTLYSSTRMGIYELLKRRWSESTANEGLPFFKKLLAGLIAGGVGAVIGNPADVAMVRMQADCLLPTDDRHNYRGVMDALTSIVREEGVLSLWRGSSLTVQRAMVVTACQLAAYDQVKERLLKSGMLRGEGVAAYVIASFCAGLASSVASTPIDVVRTRIMSMRVEAGGSPPYASPLECALVAVRHEGAFALYKGFLPTLLRQAPFSLVLFLTLEQIRSMTKNL
ncbi:hypothetical protein KP509_16G079200 [Ceratopteris richardii]|uniref:Uncharacterized protein n=1 Tax=Ceratopteris richardii TaxID=49495 RepID=A0A8T2T118_CERRI|nr:hypothetical protein KP509_16G079200 [Ceratopteris richardii]